MTVFLDILILIIMLFLIGVITININQDIAYVIYKTPKIHYFVKWFYFREKNI